MFDKHEACDYAEAYPPMSLKREHILTKSFQNYFSFNKIQHEHFEFASTKTRLKLQRIKMTKT